MKKLILLLLSIISFVPSFSQQTADWDLIFNGFSLEGNRSISQVKVFDGKHLGFVDGNPGFIGYTRGFYLSKSNWRDIDTVLVNESKDTNTRFVIQDWQYINPQSQFLLIDTTFFVGIDGMNLLYNYKSEIMKTTNSGETWTKINIDDTIRSRPAKCLSMSDSKNGVLIQYPCKYQNETTDRLLFTDNGWATWSVVKAPLGLSATYDCKYFYPNRIIIRTAAGLVFITSDLGQNWIKLDNMKPYVNTASRFYIYNDSTYFFAYTKINNKSNNIAKTTDFGSSWKFITDSTRGGDLKIFQLSLINDTAYYAHGSDALYTSDDGKTWNEQSPAFALNSQYNLSERYYICNDSIIGVYGSKVFAFYGDSTLKAPTYNAPTVYFGLPVDYALEWTPIIGADGYQIQIVENEGRELNDVGFEPEDYSSTLFKYIQSYTGTSYTMPDAKYYKTYSCRIRAYNSTQFSEWFGADFVTMKNPSGITEEVSSPNISVYPNPVSNTLSITGADSEYIQIYSAMGEKVWSGINEGNINISHLPSGTYFIRVSGETVKFVKM